MLVDRRLARQRCCSPRAHPAPRLSVASRQHRMRATETISLAQAPLAAVCCFHQQQQPLEEEEGPSFSGRVDEGEQPDALALLARELGISEEQVAWLAKHRPHLLHRPTARLRKRLHGLADLLGCAVQQAARMTQKQPELLDIEADGIRRRLGKLVMGLGGDRRRACTTARRMPLLLAADDKLDSLEQQMQQLATLFNLQLHDTGVAELCAKEPALLVMQPQQVQQRMQGLARSLQLEADAQHLVRLCRANPWLLTMAVSSIDSKVRRLASSLRLAPGTALSLVQSYPAILRQSEQLVADKVALLTEVIPRHVLRSMVMREPSLLTRSSAKVLQSFRATQEATGGSVQATTDIVAKRPGILTRSDSKPARSFRALSIWRLKDKEKQQLIQAHPLLLRLAPRELHMRCRWLRQLMHSNGFYHSTLRRIPLHLLGVIILHLPAAWSRLQYLADSSQEGRMELMDVVQLRRQAFETRFPDYRRWLNFKCSEMGCPVPWRQSRRRSPESEGQRSPESVGDHVQASTSAPGSIARPAVSPSTAPIAAVHASRPLHRDVLSEASIVLVGKHAVFKPRRLGYAPAAQPAADEATVVPGQSAERATKGLCSGPASGDSKSAEPFSSRPHADAPPSLVDDPPSPLISHLQAPPLALHAGHAALPLEHAKGIRQLADTAAVHVCVS